MLLPTLLHLSYERDEATHQRPPSRRSHSPIIFSDVCVCTMTHATEGPHWMAFLSSFADALHAVNKTLSVDIAG